MINFDEKLAGNAYKYVMADKVDESKMIITCHPHSQWWQHRTGRIAMENGLAKLKERMKLHKE